MYIQKTLEGKKNMKILKLWSLNDDLLIAFFVYVAGCQSPIWSVSNCWDLKKFEHGGVGWGAVGWGGVWWYGMGWTSSDLIWIRVLIEEAQSSGLWQQIPSEDPVFGHGA